MVFDERSYEIKLTRATAQMSGHTVSDSNNSTQPLQPHTFSIEEVCTMMNAFQGNSKNPKSGKRKISSRGDDSAKQACSMLRSMSLREPHTTIPDTSSEDKDQLST